MALPPRGYTTVAAISSYAGTPFTTPQSTYCASILASIESFIDIHMNRSWGNPPFVNEQYWLDTETIYLKSTPVSGVQQVQFRTAQVGDQLHLLTAGIDYELQDPLLGRLVFSPSYPVTTSGPPSIDTANTVGPYWAARSYVLVNYTQRGPAIPADIQLLAAALGAWLMSYQIVPRSFGMSEMRSEEQTAKLNDALTKGTLPQWISDALCGSRMPVIA